uniref:Uncharacterized protein n=1 Tax=Paramormyrops kingsleyae TaxID=1676925 RepID=A0A3B3QGK9_9TELE
PGSHPGSRPGSHPGSHPGSRPGSRPGSHPGSRPGSPSGSRPGSHPGSCPGSRPGSPPGSRPGSHPGSCPGSRPGSPPGSRPGSHPGSCPGTLIYVHGNVYVMRHAILCENHLNCRGPLFTRTRSHQAVWEVTLCNLAALLTSKNRLKKFHHCLEKSHAWSGQSDQSGTETQSGQSRRK